MGAHDLVVWTPDFSDYVGLPYVANGRVADGLDCWGLVRLIYAEQYKIDLPSYSEVDATDGTAVAEIIAREKEHWIHVADYRVGDVVLFRVDGEIQHIGVVTSPGYFIHVRENQDSVIERLYGSKWKHRVAGFYRYASPGIGIELIAVPHPLKTQRVDGYLLPGENLQQLHDRLRASAEVSEGLPSEARIVLNGQVIPREEWERCYPALGQRIEYRAVLRKGGAGRMIGMIVVTILSMMFPMFAPVIMIVGSLVVNALFPIRPPEAPNPASIGKGGDNLLQGGANQFTPYSAIPVVLGRMRFTPPAGMKSYVESAGSISYLRGCVIAGYGPLQLHDWAIGSTPVDQFEQLEMEHLVGDGEDDRAAFDALCGKDANQDWFNVKLVFDEWLPRTITGEAEKVVVAIHYPQGLGRIDPETGHLVEAHSRVECQIREVGTDTWVNPKAQIAAQTFNISSAWFNKDYDGELEAVYRWAFVVLTANSQMVVRYGAFTDDPSQSATGDFLWRLRREHLLLAPWTWDRFPRLEDGDQELWRVCIHGNDVHSTVDKRTPAVNATVTGCAKTMSGRVITVASGTAVRDEMAVISITRKTRTGFTEVFPFNVPRGHYEIQVRETVDNSGDSYIQGESYLLSTTGFINSRPVKFSKPMAGMAFKVKATNQVNGSVDGFTVTATTICPDWDHIIDDWVWRPTRNPASLVRWLWQGPFNARPTPNSGIDLDQLIAFHDHCRVNGFTYDNVILSQRSLDEIARDVCAAGRGSPMRRDGLRSVAYDKPQSQIVQHFTPSNSWNFKGSRSLLSLPHALRIDFLNADKGYLKDQRLVYNDGYTEANATKIVGIDLPGVTEPEMIYKQGRYHLAQLKLRPERYELTCDIEGLVCMRGDLVRCTHDVPMWGIGDGRIKERHSGTSYTLDQPMPMKAGTQYTIRVRNKKGESSTRTVAAVGSDGMYADIILTTGMSAENCDAGMLFMFGELANESVELIVLGIRRGADMTAVLTLCDYAPAIFSSDTEPIPAFSSHITLPPTLLQNRLNDTPIISEIISDDRAMSFSASGELNFSIFVVFSNPNDLPLDVSHVEGQFDWAGDTSSDWQGAEICTLRGTMIFRNVTEGESYKIRLRYVSAAGFTGPWTPVQTHIVVGKTAPPPPMTGLTCTVLGDKIRVTWDKSPALDAKGYELRPTDADWGLPGALYHGASLQAIIAFPGGVGSITIYGRVFDTTGHYSETTSFSFEKFPPGQVLDLTYQVIDNNVLFFWVMPEITSLPLKGVRWRRGSTYESGDEIGLKAGTFTTIFEEVGGTFDYWAAVVDTDNVEGEPVKVTVEVNEPPDYVLHATVVSSFTGTKTRLIKCGGATKALVGPHSRVMTWEDNFIENSWDSPADQIAAGYPFFAQPAADDAAYEEVFDYGTMLAATTIRVDVEKTILAGAPTLTCTISVSDTSDTGPWTDYVDRFRVAAKDFRYVKIRLDIEAADDHDLLRLDSLTYRLSVKRRYESGTVEALASDTTGTVVTFETAFIDITRITPSVKGTANVTVVCDFDDTPYPTEMRVYAFNASTGARVNATVGYRIEGV